MPPTEGSRSADGAVAVPSPGGTGAEPASPTLAELLGSPPLEPIERLEVVETLSYGILYEGREFRASRSDPVSLLQLDPALGFGPSGLPPALAPLIAAERVRGPHLLTPRAICRSGEDIYGIFDAHPGVSLASGFDFLARAGVRLSSEAILRIASGILHALDELERQDVGTAENLRCHGLLIPENIHVAENQRVLVRGVGLWQAGIARTGLLGPRQRRYLAPLQTLEGAASPRHDLITLGAILFEATAGCPAFDTPPSEDDVVELCARIEEMKATADTSRRDLFALALACLNPLAVTPASRARLRVSVDTTFLREAGRERTSGVLTLDDLTSRAKTARPAIVKAVPLTLERLEAPSRATSGVPKLGLPLPVPSPAAPSTTASVSPPAFPSPGEAGAAGRPTGSLMPPALDRGNTVGNRLRAVSRRLFPTRMRALSALAAGLLLLVVTAFVFQRSCSRPPVEDADDSGLGTPFSEPGSVPESPADSSSTAQAPAGSPAAAVSTETSSASGSGSSAGEPAPRRPEGARERDRRRAASARGVIGKAASIPPPLAAESRPPEPLEPAVAVGTLVAIGTPGLTAPVLSERPEDPRFSEHDPRAPLPGTVVLEILVDEHGRVVDHRILSANRFPTGIAAGIARYVGGLRFQAAQLRGVPVRVWIRHEMRFLAP